MKDRVEGRGALPGPTRRPGNASAPRSGAKGPGKDAPRRCCQIFGIWDPVFLTCHFFLFSLPIGQDRRGVCRWRWGQSRFDRDRLNRWDRSSSQPEAEAITEVVCSAPTSIVVRAITNHGCTNGRRSDRPLTSDRLRYQAVPPAAKRFVPLNQTTGWLDDTAGRFLTAADMAVRENFHDATFCLAPASLDESLPTAARLGELGQQPGRRETTCGKRGTTDLTPITDATTRPAAGEATRPPKHQGRKRKEINRQFTPATPQNFPSVWLPLPANAHPPGGPPCFKPFWLPRALSCPLGGWKKKSPRGGLRQRLQSSLPRG